MEKVNVSLYTYRYDEYKKVGVEVVRDGGWPSPEREDIMSVGGWNSETAEDIYSYKNIN